MRDTTRSRAASHGSRGLLFSDFAVARGLAKRSLAIVGGGAESVYIGVGVHPGMPGEKRAALRAA